MKKTIVKAWYGTPSNFSLSENEPGYKNAKEKYHIGKSHGNRKKYAMIYHCQECNKIKKQKLSEN